MRRCMLPHTPANCMCLEDGRVFAPVVGNTKRIFRAGSFREFRKGVYDEA